MAWFASWLLDEPYYSLSVLALVIAVCMELLLAWLIIDMNKYNNFTKSILAVSICDMIAIVLFIGVWIAMDQKGALDPNPNPTLDAYVILILVANIFFSWSLIVSLYISYSVYYLICYTAMLNFWNSSLRFLFFILIPVPVITSIIAAVFFPEYNKGGVEALGFAIAFQIAIYFPAALVFANLLLFLSFYCLVFGKSLLTKNSPATMATTESRTFKAVKALVNRMKYYPIIQCILFVCVCYAPTISIIPIAIPSFAYLALYLAMQPSGMQHLKSRLGLSDKPTISDGTNSSQSDQVGTDNEGRSPLTAALTNPVNKRENTLLSISTAYTQRYTEYYTQVDMVCYDDLGDDELAVIVQQSEAAAAVSEHGDVKVNSSSNRTNSLARDAL